MGPIDAFWQVMNLFAPAVSVAVIAASLVKLLWRRHLKGVGWLRLVAWSAGLSALVLLGGLVVSGRDGRMTTYLVMVLACAIGLWWAGWGGRSR